MTPVLAVPQNFCRTVAGWAPVGHISHGLHIEQHISVEFGDAAVS